MEFHEKLQELRKQKGLTQEELAEALFVSRAAISKWESGRGYPSIDSLKTIGKFFGVTIDALLSGEELLTLAEKDNRQQKRHIRDLVFGLLDCSTAIFFFLPFFGQRADGAVTAVSLLTLTEVAPYLKYAYWAVVSVTILVGIATLALQGWRSSLWSQHSSLLSLVCSTLSVLLFIISSQPYPAAFLFVYLIIKVFLFAKQQ